MKRKKIRGKFIIPVYRETKAKKIIRVKDSKHKEWENIQSNLYKAIFDTLEVVGKKKQIVTTDDELSNNMKFLIEKRVCTETDS